jgi:hypothetical protein
MELSSVMICQGLVGGGLRRIDVDAAAQPAASALQVPLPPGADRQQDLEPDARVDFAGDRAVLRCARRCAGGLVLLDHDGLSGDLCGPGELRTGDLGGITFRSAMAVLEPSVGTLATSDQLLAVDAAVCWTAAGTASASAVQATTIPMMSGFGRGLRLTRP